MSLRSVDGKDVSTCENDAGCPASSRLPLITVTVPEVPALPAGTGTGSVSVFVAPAPWYGESVAASVRVVPAVALIGPATGTNVVPFLTFREVTPPSGS